MWVSECDVCLVGVCSSILKPTVTDLLATLGQQKQVEASRDDLKVRVVQQFTSSSYRATLSLSL